MVSAHSTCVCAVGESSSVLRPQTLHGQFTPYFVIDRLQWVKQISLSWPMLNTTPITEMHQLMLPSYIIYITPCDSFVCDPVITLYAVILTCSSLSCTWRPAWEAGLFSYPFVTHTPYKQEHAFINLWRPANFGSHYSDAKMGTMAPLITGVSIVYSTVCSGQIKENIKVSLHLPLWGKITGDRWIPLTKGQ